MSTIISRCQFCRKQIEESKLMLHEMYCERNCIRCDRCGLMYDRNDQESHDEEFHKSVECPDCHEGVPDLATHQCPKKPTPCPYCKLDIPLNKFSAHEIECGSRTEKCEYCNQYVKIKHFQLHQQTCPMKKMADPQKGLREEFPSMQEVQQNQTKKYQNSRIEQQNLQKQDPFQQKQEINKKNLYSDDIWKPIEVPKQEPQGIQGRQPQQKKPIFENPNEQRNNPSTKQQSRFQEPQTTNQGRQKLEYDRNYEDNSKIKNDKTQQSQAVRSYNFQMPGKNDESLLNTQQTNQYRKTQEPQQKYTNNSKPQEGRRTTNPYTPPPVQQPPPQQFANYRNQDAHQPPKFQASNKPQPLIQPPPPPIQQQEDMPNDSMIARKIQAQIYAEDLGLSPEECEKQYDTQLNVFPDGNQTSIYKNLMYKPEELAEPKPRNQQPQKPVIQEINNEGFDFLSEEERLEQLRLYESIQNNMRRRN